MINSNAYDYINVLDKAADASWIRNEVIGNNLANIDTPGFKRRDISFEGELERALGNSRYKTMDAKVSDMKRYDNRKLIRSYIDYGNYSYRMDGNNVDVDTENVYLAENQVKYQGLMTSIRAEFRNLTTAMSGQ